MGGLSPNPNESTFQPPFFYRSSSSDLRCSPSSWNHVPLTRCSLPILSVSHHGLCFFFGGGSYIMKERASTLPPFDSRSGYGGSSPRKLEWVTYSGFPCCEGSRYLACNGGVIVNNSTSRGNPANLLSTETRRNTVDAGKSRDPIYTSDGSLSYRL